MTRLQERQAHSLESELIIGVRIVHPEIECQAADHDGRDTVRMPKLRKNAFEISAWISVPAGPTEGPFSINS